MSHFLLLLITDQKPTLHTVEDSLAPFHEFESTGVVNQYVESVDETEKIYHLYTKVIEGSYSSFREFVDLNYHLPAIEPGQFVDIYGKHMKGWYTVDYNGEVMEVIRRTNPNYKWDWWEIGGRWSGYLTPRPGTKAVNIQQSVLLGNHFIEDKINIIQKKNVDFDAMREEARDKAERLWDKVFPVIEPHIDDSHIPWKELESSFSCISESRAAYYCQPAPVAIAEALKKDSSFRGVDVDEFVVGREEYIEKKVNGAISSFATLKDGEWRERGNMRWFGYVENEKDRCEWDKEFNSLIDSLSEDAWLTIIDCHI